MSGYLSFIFDPVCGVMSGYLSFIFDPVCGVMSGYLSIIFNHPIISKTAKYMHDSDNSSWQVLYFNK
jgi:hypothetical protein